MTDTHDFQNENVLTCASETSEGTQELKPCSLSKRVNKYINSNKCCPVAKALLIEQRKHLAASNAGAEANMATTMRLLNKCTTPPEVQALVDALRIAEAEITKLVEEVKPLGVTPEKFSRRTFALYAVRSTLAAFEKKGM